MTDYSNLGIYENANVIMWLPCVLIMGGFSFSLSRIPETVQHPCHLPSLVSHCFFDLCSTHTRVLKLTWGSRLSDFWTHHMCSSHSVATSPHSPASPSCMLCALPPKLQTVDIPQPSLDAPAMDPVHSTPCHPICYCSLNCLSRGDTKHHEDSHHVFSWAVILPEVRTVPGASWAPYTYLFKW